MPHKFGYNNTEQQDMAIVLRRTLENKQFLLAQAVELYADAKTTSARWSVVHILCGEISVLIGTLLDIEYREERFGK